MINPRYLEFQDWAGQTTLLITQFGTIPKGTEPTWREWAIFVATLPAYAGVGTPLPTGFKTWRDWATAFNQQAQLVTY